MTLDPSDNFAFLYQAPYANTGSVEVYLGVGGRYVFTTPFRLKSYELISQGTILLVSLDVVPSMEDVAQIEHQLQGGVLAIPGSPPAPSFAQLVRQTPYSITVNVFNEIGEPVATKRQINVVEGKFRPISLDINNCVFSIPLPQPLTPDKARNYQVVIESAYITKMTSISTAVFESTVSLALQALEKVVGGTPANRPRIGDYFSRDAVERISTVHNVKRSVTLIDVGPGDESIVLDMLNKSIANNVTYDSQSLRALQDGYIVWTPELGRLEVKPTSVSFEDNETAIKTSSKASLHKSAKLLSTEARTSASFRAWYELQHRKQIDRGEGSGGTSADATIFGRFTGSADANVAYNFDKSFEEMSANADEVRTFNSLFTELKSEELLDSNIENRFESFWKGHNKIVDDVAKTFSLAILRNFNEASREFLDIKRLTSFGVASIPFKTNAVLLKSSRQNTEDIEDIHNEITLIKSDLAKAEDRIRNGMVCVTVGSQNSPVHVPIPTTATHAFIWAANIPANSDGSKRNEDDSIGILFAQWERNGHSSLKLVSRHLFDAASRNVQANPGVDVRLNGDNLELFATGDSLIRVIIHFQ